MSYNPNDTESVKKWLKDTVNDLFMDFLFYNRKNDEDGFSVEKVRELMDNGTISKELMLEVFTQQINSEYL